MGQAFSLGQQRDFQFTYQVQIRPLSAEGGNLKIWVPLAVSNQRQMILQREIQTDYPYEITRDLVYGNQMLFLQLPNPLPPELDLSVRYRVKVRAEHFPAEPSERNSSPEDIRLFEPHLKSNRLMVVNEQVQALARTITANSATTLQKARAIYQYVIDHMKYDKQIPGWGKGDTLRACQVGAGNCTDFHSLFISLARASGIPARFSMGVSIPEKPEGEIAGYHCWAEFYLPDAGWVPVDISEAWKNRSLEDYFFGTYDPNRLMLSLGRDISLQPRPTSCDALNIFFYPYAEVNGKMLKENQIKTSFQFKDLGIKTTNEQETHHAK